MCKHLEWCMDCFLLASFSPWLSLPVKFERRNSWFSMQTWICKLRIWEKLWNGGRTHQESYFQHDASFLWKSFSVLFVHKQACFCHVKRLCTVFTFCSFWSSHYNLKPDSVTLKWHCVSYFLYISVGEDVNLNWSTWRQQGTIFEFQRFILSLNFLQTRR